jgi:hypothetical protein
VLISFIYNLGLTINQYRWGYLLALTMKCPYGLLGAPPLHAQWMDWLAGWLTDWHAA